MLWITLTEDDILSGMTQRERDDFAKTSSASTVPDRLLPILSDLIAEIRGYIVTWAPNTISADTTLIPPSFKAKAVALARWRMLASIPGYQPGEARKLEYEKADAFFLSVAKGAIRPEPADDAVTTAVPTEKPSRVEIVSAPGSRTGRARMDGI
ncbi:MAG: hypothetical protein WCP45_11320 [Verrucomicrobiota bacterium]